MKSYFVLNYSKNCDIETVCDAVKILKDTFPDKSIIALPETIIFQEYSKEELIQRLEQYSKYIEDLINE